MKKKAAVVVLRTFFPLQRAATFANPYMKMSKLAKYDLTVISAVRVRNTAINIPAIGFLFFRRGSDGVCMCVSAPYYTLKN